MKPRLLVATALLPITLLTACGGGGGLKALQSDCMASAAIAGTSAGGTALQNDKTKKDGKTVPAGFVRSLPIASGADEATVLQTATTTAEGCGWTIATATGGEGKSSVLAAKTAGDDILKLSLNIQGDSTGRFLVVDMSNQGS